MPKVKENVDLKQLEKYGFEEKEEYYLYVTNVECLWVEKETKKIKLSSPEPYIEYGQSLSKLIELVKENLIE